MIKILHIVSSLNSGGVESMLYNYYSHISSNKIKFDFVVHGDNNGILEEKFKYMSSVVYHVTPKKISFKSNMLEINEIIKKGNYDVVHCHQNFSNFSSLYLAWNAKVPIRISHAHGCKEVIDNKEKIKNGFLRFLNKPFANYFFSCGLDAGKWLHGLKWSPNKKNKIMKNAIDVNKFSYNIESREIYRKRFDIEDKIVLLHVGRFSDEKNHSFMVDMMKQLTQENSKYILLLAGNGENKDLVKKYVDDKGLSNKIIFLGVRNDIAELMNAADLFLLPSKNEGLGMTLIEAQCTGLPILASNRVPKETQITKLIEYLPIDDIKIWVERVKKYSFVPRKSHIEELVKARYYITDEANSYCEWLEDLYELKNEIEV